TVTKFAVVGNGGFFCVCYTATWDQEERYEWERPTLVDRWSATRCYFISGWRPSERSARPNWPGQGGGYKNQSDRRGLQEHPGLEESSRGSTDPRNAVHNLLSRG